MHTPEYAFEKVEANVASGAKDLGITYPIAMDNDFSTWTNYRNRYWPAEYLIDQQGTVRHIKFGEGGYDDTEKLIRQLLSEGNRTCRPPSRRRTPRPRSRLTPETYFGVGKVVNYRGDRPLRRGHPYLRATRPNYPTTASHCAGRGQWTTRASRRRTTTTPSR